MSDTKVVSFRTKVKKCDEIDALAKSRRWDRSDLINQALDTYLDIYQWQMEHIQEGLNQIKKGETKDEKSWMRTFSELRSS